MTVAPHDTSLRPTRANVDVFGLTHTGHVRAANEDHYLVATLHRTLQVERSSLPSDQLRSFSSGTRGYLFLVADGVGGLAGGDRASGAAVRTVARYVTSATHCFSDLGLGDEEVLLEELRKAVLDTHGVLLDQEAGTATTLTMVFIAWPRAYLVHVGDSRCYRLRDGRLELLTTDQTLAQALVDSGVMSAADANKTPWKHVLSSALGGQEATPATIMTDCHWDDVMLLCTDGLTKHVTDDEIAAALRTEQTSEETCNGLVALALERGGSDNVTVVIGRLRR
jgi:serine/threonine protein phosphatase PrpC